MCPRRHARTNRTGTTFSLLPDSGSRKRLPLLSARRCTRPFGLAPRNLRDEPLGEPERRHAGLPQIVPFTGGRWRLQPHAGNTEQRGDLGAQPRLADHGALAEPEVQARDEHRSRRQVRHRARTKRGDDLRLPDLALWSLAFCSAHWSSSKSMLSKVRTQIFTFGSTSRIERFARHFIFQFRAGDRK